MVSINHLFPHVTEKYAEYCSFLEEKKAVLLCPHFPSSKNCQPLKHGYSKHGEVPVPGTRMVLVT